MSFLSRKPARPESRGGDAGRDDEYDDYDGYAQDAYQNEDDSWSPNEYFSPEGIKGRWAGENPEGRAGGRGRRNEAGPGYESYANDHQGPEYGSPPDYGAPDYGAPGYGADEFATGVYDLPDGADEDRSDRTRRRRRDREDRGERTGILRLRRDRGEDIWPDDGISDEDYWASVAADRPLNGADSPLDNRGAAAGTSAVGNARPGADAGPRMGGRTGSDPRFGSEQRGADRGGNGRLGPPPGLAGDYPPGAPGNAGAMSANGMGAAQPGGGRSSSGPMPARPGTGPQPARPATGPTPTVGVTASRPPAGQNGMRPGPAKPGPGANGYPQPSARPSFQPNGYQGGGPAGGGQGGGPAGGRTQDWGDRTERIDRVNASGYPDPRPAARGQGPAVPRTSGPIGRAAGYGSAPSAAPGYTPASGRGRSDNGARTENAARQAPDRREPDRRDHGRESSGSWPAQTRGATRPPGGADDDPLTSKAFSRSAQSETDGRSYRVAARRSQAQAQLTDQAETFITGRYQQSGQQRADRPGDYWYRDDAPTTVTQATAARYSAPNGPVPGASTPGISGPGTSGPRTSGPGASGPGSHGGHPLPPGRDTGDRSGPAYGSGSTYGGQQSQPGRNGGPGASGLPASGGPGTGAYGRPSQQQRPAQREPEPRRPPSRPQLPAAGLPAAGTPGNGLAGAGAAAGASGTSARPSNGAGGQNPYDSGVTGSYPYAGQPYGTRQATTGPLQDGADDRYYRPSGTNGYPVGSAGPAGAGQGRGDQGRGGYANGYPRQR